MNVDIRGERMNKGWTLAVAARRFGITESALSMIERELRRPTPKVALEIASAYGFKPTDVWPVEPVDPPQQPEQKKAAA